MKKANLNLGIYNQVKTLSENINHNQKFELKLSELLMHTENLNERLAEVEKSREEVVSREQFDDNSKRVQRLTEEVKEIKKDIKELLDKVQEMEEEFLNIKVDVEDMNERLKDEYINADDLQAFGANVTATIQEFVVKETPRMQHEAVDLVKMKLDSLGKEQKVLFELIEKQKQDLQSYKKDQETKERNVVSQVDEVRIAEDTESEPARPQKKYKVPDLKFSKK